MIETGELNRITIEPQAGEYTWSGSFIGIPNKRDVQDAIEHDIHELQVGEIEHEQEEAADYLIALEVLMQSEYADVDEDVDEDVDVTVAGTLVGQIRCASVPCFVIKPDTLRQA